MSASVSTSPVSPQPPGSSLESQADLIVEEMAQKILRGESIRVEDYFARTPGLTAHSEIAVRLIYEEICLRRERGDDASSEEYFTRFPQWRQSLKLVLECHHLLEPDLAPPRFPSVGETLGDFQLVAELGRGLQGRVFLATQPELADRPLVLKLTSLAGREHLSLARLQHTHIVPLFFVQEDPTRRLLILGMPYFGGATFDQLLNALPGPGRGVRSGRALVEALDRLQATSPIPIPVRGRARQFLMQASGVQAVCWIGACLADALQYPHERGLVHLDVKPSNVLLTADGLPMLLDFHLARECIQPDGPPPEWLGGTPAYMSPEQQSALEALRNGSHVASAVDVRSDIFSLGMLLFELLGGSIPISLESPDLRATLPALPVGLADVLAKCLGKDPKDRYASAADLATDLRRQMSDLPLKGVRNRSHLERWRKWRRRRPHGLAVLGLLAIALTALAAATFINMLHQSQKHDEVRHALETAQRQVEDHQFKEALKSVRRGQDLAGGLLNSTDLIQELELQAKAAEQGQIAEELHRAADHVRLHQGVNSSSVPQARSLEQLCWNIWEKREEIAKRLSLNTDAEAKHRIHGDLLDLAILWTELHIGLAIPQELSSARREALAVLDQAEALFGPSPVLYLKRQSVCEQLGLSKEAEKAQTHLANTLPKTAWEHYSLGRFYLQAGDCEEAVLHFDRAIECEPKEIWAHFYKGMAAYKLNRYQEAVLAFSAFIALGPESAQSYFNRALALDALNDPNLALADYDHVLKLDPTMAPAAFHRGQLHFHQKRYNQALSDYRFAMQNGADQADVYYYMALANQARNDRSAALQDLANCLKANPHHNEAQKLKEKLSKK